MPEGPAVHVYHINYNYTPKLYSNYRGPYSRSSVLNLRLELPLVGR